MLSTSPLSTYLSLYIFAKTSLRSRINTFRVRLELSYLSLCLSLSLEHMRESVCAKKSLQKKLHSITIYTVVAYKNFAKRKERESFFCKTVNCLVSNIMWKLRQLEYPWVCKNFAFVCSFGKSCFNALYVSLCVS